MASPVHLSCAIYTHLLVFYPRELRSEFKGEMALVFEDMMQDAIRRRGCFGMISLWYVVLLEVATVAIPQRLKSRALLSCVASFITSLALFLAIFRAIG